VAQDNAFKHKLDVLKAQNNLIEWLYQRLEYVYSSPEERLPFLLETEKKIWRQPSTAEEKNAWLNLLNNLGYYELISGNILNAVNSYENAYSYYLKNKSKLTGFDLVEYTLKPLSNNYTRLGDYERALFLQKKSIEILNQNNQQNATPSIYSNMAISYRLIGDMEAAEKSIQTGLKIASSSNEIIILLNNIYADLLFDQNRLKEAKTLIEQNIAKQKTTNIYWLMGAYTTAGNISLGLNDLNTANTYYQKALFLLNNDLKGQRRREKTNVLIQIGKIKVLQKNPTEALKIFKNILHTLQLTDKNNTLCVNKIYGDHNLVDIFEQMSRAYLLIKNPAEAYKNIELALYTANKIRNEFANNKTKERLQASTKSIVERGIEICYSQYQQTHNQGYLDKILNLAEQSKSRTLLDQIQKNQQLNSVNQKDSLFIKRSALENAIAFNERQEIETKKVNKNTDGLKYNLALINKKIREKYQQFNISYDSIPTAKRLQHLPKTRILEYFFGLNAIYLIDINHNKISHVEKIDHAEKIKNEILDFSNNYFQKGPDAMLNAPNLFFKASHRIYTSIFKNVTFNKNESVTIIPDEILGYLSFDGLITKNNYGTNISNWPFLIKQCNITYAFSLNTLVENKQKLNKYGFTGMFITHAANNSKPLQAVEQEANAIKKLISGKFLFNKDVNATAFKQAFENSKILHIGTHAYLSGKNAEPTLDLEHEKIFLFELSAQKTAPALVVLSACRTADGILANGEGIISLSRGFSSIGTPATIAGLWNVNDGAASVIMANFYKHLVNKKNGGDALHLAKIDWLNMQQSTDALYLPYYWDSLIYMGYNQKVELQSNVSTILIFSLILLLTCLFEAIIFLKNK